MSVASSIAGGGSAGSGSGDTVGPASATDNAVARFDGTTGKLLQNSVVTASDAGAVAGVTQLDVDNVRVDGNTISITAADGHLLLDANGAGNVRVGQETFPIRLSVYGAHTDDSNYGRISLDAGSNYAAIEYDAAGTGSGANVMYIANKNADDAAHMVLQTRSTERWRVTGTGHMLAGTDNSYDIGAAGATRPRNGYFAGTLSFGTHSAVGGETVSGFITITDAGGTTRKLAVIS